MSRRGEHKGWIASVIVCLVIGLSGGPFLCQFSDGTTSIDGDVASWCLGTGIAPVFVVEPLDPRYVEYGVSWNFTAIVRDADGDALRVTWDWGDGNTSVTTTGPAGTNQVITGSHSYTPPVEQGRGSPGSPYQEYLNLTIFLDDGNDNNVSCETQVIVDMPDNGIPSRPSIRLNGTMASHVDPSDEVFVVANASDPEGESLTWTYSFLDDNEEVYRTVVLDTPATEPDEMVWVNVSHSFGTVGTHRIDVYVSDALVPYQLFPHNRTNSTFASVVVNSAPLVTASIFADPSTPVINSSVGYVDVSLLIEVFDSDGDALTAAWDFGDFTAPGANITSGGALVYMLTQEHRYFETGTYNVTVAVTDGRPDHEVLRYRLLTVISNNLPPQYVLFSYTCHGLSPPFDYVGEVVYFSLTVTDPEQDPIEVVWDFGDGSPLVSENITDYLAGQVTSSVNHTYLAPGPYTITVNYTDNLEGILDHLRSLSADLEVIVDVVPPHADAGTDQVVFVGDIVQFDGSDSSDNWAIANYTWTFIYNGSLVTLWGSAPSFEFWTPGLYLVTLNVTDMVGQHNSSSVYVAVYDEIPEFGPLVLTTTSLLLVLVLVVSSRRRRRA